MEKWIGKLDEQEYEKIFTQIDDDGSGEIDFGEFSSWAIKRSFLYHNVDNDDTAELTKKQRLLQKKKK